MKFRNTSEYNSPENQKTCDSFYRWFDGFNWEGLVNRTLSPPILPQVKHVTDTSNFDEYPPDADGLPPDAVTGWAADF